MEKDKSKRKRLLAALIGSLPLLIISILWTYLVHAFFDPDMRVKVGIPSGPWIDTLKREHLDRLGPFRLSIPPYIITGLSLLLIYALTGIRKGRTEEGGGRLLGLTAGRMGEGVRRLLAPLGRGLSSISASLFDPLWRIWSLRFFPEAIFSLILLSLFSPLFLWVKGSVNPGSLPIGVDWHDWIFCSKALETGELEYYRGARMPLYPALSTLLIPVAGDAVKAQQALSMAAGILYPPSLFLLFRAFVPPLLAFLGSITLILLPSLFFFSISNSGYILFALTSILSLLAGIHAIRSGKRILFLLSGIFSALSMAGVLFGFIYLFIILLALLLSLAETWRGFKVLLFDTIALLLPPLVTKATLMVLPLNFADISIQALSGTLDTPYIMSSYGETPPVMDGGRTPLPEFPRLELVLSNFERFPAFFLTWPSMFWFFLVIGSGCTIGRFFRAGATLFKRIALFTKGEGFILLSLLPLLPFWWNGVLSERFLLPVLPIVLFLVMKGIYDFVSSLIRGGGAGQFLKYLVFISLLSLLLFKGPRFLKNPPLFYEGLEKGTLDARISLHLAGLLEDLAGGAPEPFILDYSLEFFAPFIVGIVPVQNLSLEIPPEKVKEEALLRSKEGKTVFLVLDNLDFRRNPSFIREEHLSTFSSTPFTILIDKTYPTFRDESSGLVRRVIVARLDLYPYTKPPKIRYTSPS